MNARDFYAWLGPSATLPPDTSADVKLEHVWQFDLAIQAASDSQAVALTNRNPKLARDYAAQEAVREALDAPNPLHAEIAEATDKLAALNAAPAAVRAEYADDLAILAYDQDQLSASYRSLVLGE
ncbi:MAG TPA: hypothetical protein VN325_33460 [Steroidobacteraceae bacterium]|nr:hypothetical protein [Steroidobacteraceae bacterium]